VPTPGTRLPELPTHGRLRTGLAVLLTAVRLAALAGCSRRQMLGTSPPMPHPSARCRCRRGELASSGPRPRRTFSDIEVSVHDGEVTLTGTTADRWMKRDAEDAIESLPGVRDVHNQLRLMGRGEGTTAGQGLTGTAGGTLPPGGLAETAGVGSLGAAPSGRARGDIHVGRHVGAKVASGREIVQVRKQGAADGCPMAVEGRNGRSQARGGSRPEADNAPCCALPAPPGTRGG
jgi:hypothetical protein